ARDERSELPQKLRMAAAALERLDSSRDAIFWAQVLRSAANKTEQVLSQTPAEWTSSSVRDRHMSENLLWLAKTYHPDRKIIVWGHADHLMRNWQFTSIGRQQGFSAG